MDIIINPTNKCNFDCSFCCARYIPENSLSAIETINKLKIYGNALNMIVINGGDPLMMDPSYYEELIKYVETLGHKVFISLTTNLLDWYKNPRKWDKILSDYHVGVITSFQYGDKRRLANRKIYTDIMFADVVDKFNEQFGYKPNFISVIDWNNYKNAMKTVRLAKELGVQCKLNKVLTVGKARETEHYFPRYKMLRIYCNIIDAGLIDYEMSIENIKNYFTGKNTACPLNRNCYKGIRTINSDGAIYQCPNTAYEDRFNKYELKRGADYDKFAKDYMMIKKECIGCPNYNFCNSCRSMIEEVKRKKDEESYCKNMHMMINGLKERFL